MPFIKSMQKNKEKEKEKERGDTWQGSYVWLIPHTFVGQ